MDDFGDWVEMADIERKRERENMDTVDVGQKMEDYLAGDQINCFMCGSENLYTDGVDWIASDCIEVKRTCGDCDTSWEDEYWLSAVNHKESRVTIK
jgi:hypothetical protein